MRSTAKSWGWLAAALLCAPGARAAQGPDLEKQFTETVRPFVASYCLGCHGGEKPKGDLDLRGYDSVKAVAADLGRWAAVLGRLGDDEMPPRKSSAKRPPAALRKQVIAWIQAVRREELRKNAGDPGPVLARRLSNAEYNYTIRDLTGVDLQPTREFPVDPTNQSGFDNSGESLMMSPALMTKYLQAARSVASHLVLAPGGIAFAPHPVLVDTDRDKYCVQRIVDFYQRQPTDYADYFLAAWRYQHRAALGSSGATLARVAADSRVSPQYLATIWEALQKREEVGPLAKLQAQFRALPAPHGRQPDLARPGAAKMRDYVVALRRKLEPRFEAPVAKGLRGTAQPLLMWKNREYATHRRSFDPKLLQVEGEGPPAREPAPKVMASAAADEEEEPSAPPPRKQGPDEDLRVPAGQRARYEAAFGRFASVFPDAFYVSERGRNYLDKTKDKGRLLSAGFHNLMGYFRDDQPLYELVLDARGKAELDGLWREMDFVADVTARTFTQFYLSESGLARAQDKRQGASITAAATIARVAESYRGRAAGNAVALKAVDDHFRIVEGDIRWAEKARSEAEPLQLKALLDLAARAYRHPLSSAERDDLGGYYRAQRDQGLSHDEALRDTLVAVLMSPDFCYRVDVVEPGSARALSDQALASRLSYFLWSSLPDDDLMKHAAAGDLHQPAVLAAQARRMLKDPRARGLSTEFGGNWLDFRRFEQHNAVDRERFPAFTNELRQAMFEEPVRFIDDVVRNDRSILDLVYGRHTFVNPVLARHYGMTIDAKDWVRVDDARKYGRGGLLPMAVFLTQNAPGLRTSPVKRGYWVVRRVLGEVIPPPPAVVPELPRDEAKSELPLREMLAQHRQDPSCAACHARFDAFGLAFEGYGPVGEVRTKDLAGRPVDARASFPGGGEGTGLEGLTRFVKAKREKDFVDNLCRKLLSYALGRSLIAADDVTIEQMKGKLARNGYRFGAMVEAIVQSPQFLTKRGREVIAQEVTR